jgi:hypothetical protein
MARSLAVESIVDERFGIAAGSWLYFTFVVSAIDPSEWLNNLPLIVLGRFVASGAGDCFADRQVS